MNRFSLFFLTLLLLTIGCRAAAPTPTPQPAAPPPPTLTAAPAATATPLPAQPAWQTEAVRWVVDDVPVEGTLTLPAGDGPFPAVLLVAGSGPTDRDWNSPLLPGTNGSAALLATLLTENGYATLRYDKRVAGPSAAANLPQMVGKVSLQGHLDEVAGGVRLLAAQPGVDPARIYGLGNSEGALHVLNYQRQAQTLPFAGLILAAPPGRPLGELMRSQLAAQLQGAVIDPEGTLTLYDEAMARFLAGEPANPSPELPDGISQLLNGLEIPLNLPFTREIMSADPVEWLVEIGVPVVVIIGRKDVQVDWQVDGARLQSAAAGMADVSFAFPQDADHVLKYETKGAGSLTSADALRYNQAGRLLDGETTTILLTWLAGQE
jgi:dienelactone hydrolase